MNTLYIHIPSGMYVLDINSLLMTKLSSWKHDV